MRTIEDTGAASGREDVREARATDPDRVRERLLAGLPVTQSRLELAGVSTTLIEAGDGDPVVLLHGPGEHAPKWLRVIPGLAEMHRVIAPDLPGHGASTILEAGPLDGERVLSWLGELIDRTCPSPPILIGQIVGGAIAARFAIDHEERIHGLVLVDSLGLAPFDPAPEFGEALMSFMTDPTEDHHDRLWRHCAYDVDLLRERMGERWGPFRAYNIDRAGTPSVSDAVQALMEAFGYPPIPEEDLDRVDVPTTLIWGRHDLATSLEVAERASERYGWPLHVIDDAADDPALECPDAFIDVIRRTVAAA